MVSQMYGWMDGWCKFEIQEGWVDGWMDKSKFEIVVVVSQMYGWIV